MICSHVTLVNKLGLHARASAKLVTLASSFESDVTLSRNGQQVNAKSIMGILMLAASKGTEINICADGADAQAAVDALAELVNNCFGEDE